MELMIFSGNYMYATDVLFEVFILILLFLISVSILPIILYCISFLFKKLYLNIFASHVSVTLKSQMISHIINAFYRPFGILIILLVFA